MLSLLRVVMLTPAVLVACASTGPETELRSPSAAESQAEPGRPFVGVQVDPEARTVRLAFDLDGRPLLHVVALVAGLGSNRIGLDRGQLSSQTMVVARRAAGRLELVAPQLERRVGADDPALATAAREAFAESVLASLEIVGEDEYGRVLVDATDFLASDAHGIARALERSGQGRFELDRERSRLIDQPGLLLDNSYVDVLQTFACDDPGSEVADVAPVADSVTLTIRHHFVRLPEDPMPTRAADPRAGYFECTWTRLDAAPTAPARVAVIQRHRLPADGGPIIYYLDRGAPEPMRSALLDGARYWEQAFAEAGLPGRFRVELLPEGADIHDVRFNTIQWVFRSTRGWSYGNSIVDPRTGEILKGHVTLGALRVRQDVRLIEGLLSPYAKVDDDPRVMEAALARLRQLAAHEVGHTLGLRHHFAASTRGRSSVMDYPPPRVELAADGTPSVEDAYRASAGEWDALAIRYGYSEFELGDGRSVEQAERDGLAAVLAEAEARGLELLSDGDADGNLHPRAHRWDDGESAAAALAEALAVRRAALERFGGSALVRGRPLADLELALVPLHFHHRYQVEAAVAVIGGRAYRHEVRWDGDPVGIEPVSSSSQRVALESLLAALAPEVLGVPERVRRLLPPAAPGAGRGSERFDPDARLFEPLAVARATAALVLEPLLASERLERLAVQAADDPDQLDLRTVLEALLDWGWRTPDLDASEAQVRREARALLLERLLDLTLDPSVTATVRAEVIQAIGLSASGDGWTVGLPLDLGERFVVTKRISDPIATRIRPQSPRIPPGPPIGCGHPHNDA
jgi:hypothetical protein